MPLMLSAMRGSLEISELLFKGADINARDTKEDKYTVLMYAVINGNEKLVKWLIAKGDDVNVSCQN